MKSRLFAAAASVALLAGTAAARADEKADTLLKEVITATKAVTTLTADFTYSLETQGRKMAMEGTAKVKRPNLARIDSTGSMAQTIASDGKTIWTLRKDENQYIKTNADPEGKIVAGAVMPHFPLSFFFNPTADLFGTGSAMKIQGVSNEKVADRTFQVIEGSIEKPVTASIKLYVGPDKLLHRVALTYKQDSETVTIDAALQNVKTGVALAASQFAYKPPKNAKLFEQPNFEAKLVSVGKEAPNFTLPTPDGGQVALGEAVKGKKAVLVNFWFYGCGPCRAEFPHLQKIYTDLKDKGLELIAINNGDPKEVINKYIDENKWTFKIVMGGPRGGKDYGVFEQYGVQAYPTNYLLDGEGKVVWRSVGFNEAALLAALEKMGLK